jgi:peptidoglycan/xylan/chitin deacetylase (PgdA/CDA1 family)
MKIFHRVVPVISLLLLTAAIKGAQAEPCPGNPNALGTSRVLQVEPGQYGTKHFPQTLALGPHEVVLTFDDGPNPPTTSMVLAALARECVKATFFLVGRNAEAHPDFVQKIAAAGHTVAHHSMTHPMTLATISYPSAIDNIERGIRAVEKAAAPYKAAPFFRFPGFGSSPALLSYFDRKGYAVFGADLWASDWNEMTPQFELSLVMDRLRHAGRGIILFHDIHLHTARMMPAFLAALKAGGWKVVHIVPARQG